MLKAPKTMAPKARLQGKRVRSAACAPESIPLEMKWAGAKGMLHTAGESTQANLWRMGLKGGVCRDPVD